MASKVIMTDSDIRRALARIAHEIIEQNRGVGDLVLVGLQTRGVPLAARLQSLLQDLEKQDVPTGALDVTFYRDDLAIRSVQPVARHTDIPVDVTDKSIVLVDDVLYTGRTIRSALSAVMDFGRPRRVQLAVLVDRGHRELPIQADYVGKSLPTSSEEDVVVCLEEIDGRDEVLITRD